MGKDISEIISYYKEQVRKALDKEIISTLEQYKYALVVAPIGFQINRQIQMFNVTGYDDIKEAQEAAQKHNYFGSRYSAAIYCYNAEEISRLSAEL